MELDERIDARISRELKRTIQDKRIDASKVIREALLKAAGLEDSIQSLMQEEESRFAEWTESFVRLYQFINKKLEARESLIISEVAQLEELWKRVQDRMKSREQLIESIPELRALAFEDAFDWQKIFSIIEKYPQSLKGKVGFVQVREALFYREVKAGRFSSVQEAQEKLKAEIERRADLVKKELTEWTGSKEMERQYMIKQEELRIEAERKQSKEFKDAAKATYDHTANCEDVK